MNFRPLCTAIVWPTISGTTVDRRDQVLMTFFSFAAVHPLDLLEQRHVDEGTLLE